MTDSAPPSPDQDILAAPLELPCGVSLPNRLAKAAMTEGLADSTGVPTENLQTLYGLWSDGGAGMLLSGNIMIDRDHLERPGNVVVDREPDAAMRRALADWAGAATRNGNHFWAQISHAGRQTQKIVNPHPKAPSAVKLGLPGGQFGEPVALTEAEIADIVGRFALCARVVRDAGFTGVQVHAAHGYLLSQFLSPRSNQRTDRYGGVLENRARLLLGVEGLEEVEPQSVRQSTAQREAYFVDFALAMREQLSIPLMVTGGFRRREAMEHALSSGAADLVGLGRPMCVMTDAPARLLGGLAELPRYEDKLELFPSWLSFLKRSQTLYTLATFSVQYWFYAQLDELGKRGSAAPEMSVFSAARRLMSLQKQLLAGRV